MIILENNLLTVKILTKGAELCSIAGKTDHTEYLWQGDPAYWNKHSPILFPIVGTLKNDTYVHQGTAYTMSRHGFARDREFAVIRQENNCVCLELKADEATLQQYPFLFSLRVDYTLRDNNLTVAYTVINQDEELMYFSIGGHPAFNLPIDKTLKFEDYTLKFEAIEQAKVYPLNAAGHLLAEGLPFFNHSNCIALKKSLFYEDALIFKDLRSGKLQLVTEKDSRTVTISFEQFPFLGIWSKKDADFICIEPWQGITDGVNASGLLEEKEGICALEPKQQWHACWQVSFND